MTTWGFFRDENGNPSQGRVLLTFALVLTFALIYLDARAPRWDVPEPAYGLLAVIFVGLLGWVGGPRIMQHIGSQLGAIMQRMGGNTSSWGSWGSSGPASPSTPEDVEP
jgi:hypothetical protein